MKKKMVTALLAVSMLAGLSAVNVMAADDDTITVEEWIRKEKEFSIRYLEKENGMLDSYNNSVKCKKRKEDR